MEEEILFQNKYRVATARWRNWDYSWDGYYFVTICVKNRECCLGDIFNGEMKLSEFGNVVNKILLGITDGYDNAVLDACVIMPNHIYIIIGIHCDEHDQKLMNNVVGTVETIHELSLPRMVPTPIHIARRQMLLSKIIGRFKMQTAKEINLLRNTPGNAFWQSRFHDRVIRDERELNAKRRYIFNNPVKWQFDKHNPNKKSHD